MPPRQAAVLTYRIPKGKQRAVFLSENLPKKTVLHWRNLEKRGSLLRQWQDFCPFFQLFHNFHPSFRKVIHKLLITLCITFVSCGFSADEKNMVCSKRPKFPFFRDCAKHQDCFSTPLCIKSKMCCPYTGKKQGTVGKPMGYPQHFTSDF